MRVYIGTDHAGFALKTALLTYLTTIGHDVVDVGPREYDPSDDYPVYCIATAERVVDDWPAMGVLVGESGNGEQIAANKVVGARAALAWSTETARMAREHLDANIVAIGTQHHNDQTALEVVGAFLATPFSGDLRHQRRIIQAADYELTHHRPHRRRIAP